MRSETASLGDCFLSDGKNGLIVNVEEALDETGFRHKEKTT
jgi:hypothetical protein